MNKKAFTLVELIATIVILGVLMTIAIPNVLSIIEKNKQEDFIETAKLLMTEAEYKVRSDTSIELPKENNHAVVITLNYLNSDNFDQSPYEYKYDKLSFALIVKEGNSYKYYVHLTASQAYASNTVTTYAERVLSDSKNRGINLATMDDLNGDSRFNLIEKGAEVDIDMFKSMNDTEPVKITTTTGTIQVTIDNILI